MSNRLLLKSSGTADAVPDFDDLELAELVVNTRNGKMFCKTYDGLTYAIVDLTLSSPDEIIASGPGLIGRSASGAGPAALLSGADVVAQLPAATSSADGKITAAQFGHLFTASGRPRSSGQILSATFTASTETTFQDIAGLTFAIDANETIILSGKLFLSTAAAVDYKLSVNGPASPSLVMVDFWHFGSGYTATGIVTHTVVQSYDSPTAYDAASDNDRVVSFAGTIINGSTAGTIALRVAKRVAGSSDHPNVNAGSMINIMRV